MFITEWRGPVLIYCTNILRYLYLFLATFNEDINIFRGARECWEGGVVTTRYPTVRVLHIVLHIVPDIAALNVDQMKKVVVPQYFLIYYLPYNYTLAS